MPEVRNCLTCRFAEPREEAHISFRCLSAEHPVKNDITFMVGYKIAHDYNSASQDWRELTTCPAHQSKDAQ